MANAAVLKTAALKGAYRFESCALRADSNTFVTFERANDAHSPVPKAKWERG